MPSRTVRHHLEDILTSIEYAQAFVAEIDFAPYAADRKTRSSVERELQIITEAAIRLGDDAEVLCPGPDWIGFRGMGNVIATGITTSTTRPSGTRSKTNFRRCVMR